MEDLSSYRRPARRRLPRQDADLCRALPHSGLCPTHLPGEFAGHRGLSVGASAQALPHGHPRSRFPFHAGRCQRNTRLAYLCRVCTSPDRASRQFYASEDLGLDLSNTVYALDSTTIDLCLSVFPWANFRTTKAAIKLHTLLDLRGSIPSFIHISDGKMHDTRALDLLIPEAGAIYVMDRAYVDFVRLHRLYQACSFFVTRAKSNLDAHRVYSSKTDRSTGIICDQTIALDGFYTRQDYPERVEEALHRRIVPAVSLATHALADRMSAKQRTIIRCCISRPLVRMQYCRTRSAPSDGNNRPESAI